MNSDRISGSDETMVYYTFLTQMGGLPPREVDELPTALVQELLHLNNCVQRKQEQELKKAR